MAATQKLYPRGTVKRIVKSHANRNVSKNADILVSIESQEPRAKRIDSRLRLMIQIFLDYMLFMQE